MNLRQEAARLIRQHGWEQNALSSKRGYSMFGAIAKACTGDHRKISAEESTILRELHEELGVDNLWVWHEQPDRSAHEVIRALEGAA
jgi:hypothetical protein